MALLITLLMSLTCHGGGPEDVTLNVLLIADSTPDTLDGTLPVV